MSLKKKALSGIVWTFAQQFGSQAITFLVSIVLARLLLPSEFGIIGMITVFISIGSSLANSGMTQSLIRTENPDQEDFSTVFFFNLTISTVIYAIIFAGAPFVADFYNQPILKNVLRVYSLSFIIQAFSTVQLTRLTKLMEFKTQMIVALPSLIGSGIVGIVMGYKGFGVWALVWMNLVQVFLSTVQLWWYSGWFPSLVFSKAKFREHFGFGFKLTLSGLLNTVFANIYQIVIGKFFSPAQVGFYTRAVALKQLPVSNISSTLNKVSYPLFASIQNDDVRLRRVYKQLMQIVTFLLAPLLLLMGVLGEPLFRLLFTEKWLPAVPYFQVVCLNGILYPIHSYNLNILKVKGRSDLFLRLEVVKRIITIGILSVTIPLGIIPMLWGQVLSSVLAFGVNTFYSGKFINYTAWQQSRDLLPTLTLGFAAALATFALDKFYFQGFSDFMRLFLGFCIGGVMYLLTNYLFKTESMNHFYSLIIKRK